MPYILLWPILAAKFSLIVLSTQDSSFPISSSPVLCADDGSLHTMINICISDWGPAQDLGKADCKN